MTKKKFIVFISFYCFVFLIFSLSFGFYLKSLSKNSQKSVNGPPLSSLKPVPVFIPLFSLESIFAPDHSWVNQLDKGKVVTLITTGDVIPARTVNYKMTIYNDFTHPFKKTADFLQSADLTLINLEAPLIENCPTTNTGMIFCGNQRFVEGLVFGGIDLVGLANNHTLNWGIEGIEQTINLLKENDIESFGFPVNQMAVKNIKGTKVGFLGWNLLEDFDQNEVLETIKQAKKEIDLLIVTLHWGAEYTHFPAQKQKQIAHQIIDAGADLIAANHPHWIQPIEVYNHKVIIYAQGNFIFDQEWSQETKTGYLTKIVFYENKVVDLQVFPIFISDYNQPEFLENQEKLSVLNQLQQISIEFSKEAEKE